MLYVWQGEVDWFIAETEVDVLKAYEEHYGNSPEDDDSFTKLAMDVTLKITFEDGIDGSGEYEVVEKTMREWIEYSGRGFLASTEW